MCCGGKIVSGAVKLGTAAMGLRQAQVGVIEARRVICRQCPHATPCPVMKDRKCLCTQCGCLLVAKTRLRDERCPLGKWDSAS